MREIFYKTSLIIIILCVVGCTNEEPEPISNAIDRGKPFQVINNQTTLNQLVSHTNSRINVRTIGTGSGRAASIENELELTLISEIESPQIDGSAIMATSISDKDGLLIASYNTSGAEYSGGAMLINRTAGELSILSQVLFEERDISHAVVDDNRIYLGGSLATEAQPSWIGSFNLTNDQIEESSFSEVALGGYVTTSLALSGSSVYATSGAGTEAGSGLFQFNSGDLTLVSQIPMEDPRWVVASGDHILVQNGRPGRLNCYENDILINSYTIGEADLDAKSSFDVVDEFIFAATGVNGVEMYSLEGDLISNVPIPASANSDFTSNAVAVYGDLVFISNGTTIYLASFESDEDPNPVIIGELELGDSQSINHISFQDNYMIVAAGLGGIKVIEVNIEANPPSEGTILSRENMEIIYFDSEEPKVDKLASYVLDGDRNTHWHTEWVDQIPDHPHELWIDMGTSYRLTELRYLARQLGNYNGTVKDYEIYVSENTTDWGTAVKTGSFKKTREEQIALFDEPATGRYLRFIGLSEVNGGPWTSCAEINFVGSPAN